MNWWNKLTSGEGGIIFVILIYIVLFSIAIPGTLLGWFD